MSIAFLKRKIAIYHWKLKFTGNDHGGRRWVIYNQYKDDIICSLWENEILP